MPGELGCVCCPMWCLLHVAGSLISIQKVKDEPSAEICCVSQTGA